jgi:hypothetical protein
MLWFSRKAVRSIPHCLPALGLSTPSAAAAAKELRRSMTLKTKSKKEIKTSLILILSPLMFEAIFFLLAWLYGPAINNKKRLPPELSFNNSRSGAEFSGEKSLKNYSSHTDTRL